MHVVLLSQICVMVHGRRVLLMLLDLVVPIVEALYDGNWKNVDGRCFDVATTLTDGSEHVAKFLALGIWLLLRLS